MESKLVDIIKSKGFKVAEIARLIDVSPARIYEWNKRGISEDNPHFKDLKQIIPEVESSGKSKYAGWSRRKPKELVLYDTDFKIQKRPQRVHKDYPKIIFKKKEDKHDT